MGRTCTRRHHVIVKTGLDLDATSTQKVETVSEYSISEAAARLDVTTRTLRYWDRIGLLSPQWRTYSDYRIYTEADIGRALKVLVHVAAGQIAEELPQLARALLPLMRARRRCGCCRWTFRSRGRCPRALHFRGRPVGEYKKSADLQISLT